MLQIPELLQPAAADRLEEWAADERRFWRNAHLKHGLRLENLPAEVREHVQPHHARLREIINAIKRMQPLPEHQSWLERHRNPDGRCC